jgi:hypothetical protein
MGLGGQHHVVASLPPGKRPGTHCIGGWVGPRAGLDGCYVSMYHTKIRAHKRTFLHKSDMHLSPAMPLTTDAQIVP